MTHFWKYLLVFVACILSQVFLLDNIQLLGFVMPYAYPLFILILPTNLSRPWLYIFGFLLGLSIDLFAATLCLHAAATTLLAFLRGPVINFATPQQQLQKTQLPILRTMGVAWTLRYTTVHPRTPHPASPFGTSASLCCAVAYGVAHRGEYRPFGGGDSPG